MNINHIVEVFRIYSRIPLIWQPQDQIGAGLSNIPAYQAYLY
jgi:hypothetical protein